jgi:hypothetical protein
MFVLALLATAIVAFQANVNLFIVTLCHFAVALFTPQTIRPEEAHPQRNHTLVNLNKLFHDQTLSVG